MKSDFDSFSNDEFDTKSEDDKFRLTDDDWRKIEAASIKECDYDEFPGVRFSYLSRFSSCPMYYIEKENMAREETSEMAFGTAFHCFLLEFNKFTTNYRIFTPPINERTGEPYKSGKAFDEATQKFRKEGFSEMTPEMITSFSAMKNNLASSGWEGMFKHENGRSEVGVFATVNGHVRKCKIDFLNNTKGIIDVKTTGKPISNAFGDNSYRWHIRDFYYVEQVVYYKQTLEAVLGRRLDFRPKIVAFETKQPYRVGRFTITEKTETEAAKQIEAWESVFYGELNETSDRSFCNYEWVI